MAISPPSDILLDVASAADPAKVRAATARLAALAADPGAQNIDFSEALSRAKAQSATPSGSLQPPATFTASLTAHGSVSSKPSAYQKFESQVLQTFIEAMLPQDDESFGDKVSSGVYRSLMAEQLADQMAAAGGIGLAKSIEAAHPALPQNKTKQG